MNTFEIIKQTHVAVVFLFMLIYLTKTAFLLLNKNDALAKMTKTVKVPEMIISFTFLATGIFMLIKVPEINSFMIIKLICVFAAIPVAIVGYKKSNKALAVVSLLLIIGSYGLAEVGSKKRKSGSETVAANSTGEEIYLQKCVSCHGKKGDAGLSGATDLTLSNLDDNSIIELIKNGKPDTEMRSFAKQLDDAQIKLVTEYIKTLRK